VIDPKDWNEIFDKPELTQPPLRAVYVNLPFSCAPWNTPAVTVPVMACVVTGVAGTSESLMAMVDVRPVFHVMTSVALIAAEGGVPRVLQFSPALLELTNFTLPPETLVLPGHGLDTTVGTERPHLDEWVERGW